jgi:hypothetical protein
MAGIGDYKEQMYTDVLRIGAGFHHALDAGVHARTRSLGSDDGAYRQPARMIESGAMIHVFVSAKANGILGGTGLVLVRAARRAPARHLLGWGQRPMRTIQYDGKRVRWRCRRPVRDIEE